jgi:hypothetical protein
MFRQSPYWSWVLTLLAAATFAWATTGCERTIADDDFDFDEDPNAPLTVEQQDELDDEGFAEEEAGEFERENEDLN